MTIGQWTWPSGTLIDRVAGMSERRCPVDGAKLVEIEHYGAIVDQCPVCSGIWCDKGELETMVDTAARALAKLRRGQANRKPFTLTTPAMRAVGHHRTCPIDGAGLIHRERHGVAIDLCPLCHGIWLDTDELQAIINLTAECLIAMGPDADLDTVELPLSREPDRKSTGVAAHIPSTLTRKHHTPYSNRGSNVDSGDLIDILESVTSLFTED